MFEHRVLLRNRRMRPQAVAKPDPIMPEGTPEWHEVKMVCSLSETGLTEPVHDIRSIRRILVSCFEQCGQCISRCFQTSDSCHDIDDGFRRQIWDGRAPHVFDRPDEPWAKHSQQKHAFSVEERRPIPVVRDDIGGRFVCSGHRLGCLTNRA